MLAVPGVMRRLDLDAQAVEQMARQLREAGVRWGEDERARAECGGYREFSFAFGIDRLLAGFACGDEDDALVSGVAPLAGVEGAAFARLDALLAALDTWRRARELASREMPAASWQREWNALFDRLYAADHDDLAETRALERVRAALARLVEDSEAAHVKAPLPWGDVRAFLREQLEQADARQQLFSGGVTFCGMVPLRVVPFRVVCLLGMDEAAFPRRDPNGLDPLLLDRRAGKQERGDRNVREDDRLLFLQLLAAARDAFYVSWVGRDARSNETLPPSVVVAELMDALREGYLRAAPDDAANARGCHVVQAAASVRCGTVRCAKRRASYGEEWLPAAARRSREEQSATAPFVRGRHCRSGNAAHDEAPDAGCAAAFLRRSCARLSANRRLALHLPRENGEDADDEPLPRRWLLRYRSRRNCCAIGEAQCGRAIRDLARARPVAARPIGDEAALRCAHLTRRCTARCRGARSSPRGDTPLSIETPARGIGRRHVARGQRRHDPIPRTAARRSRQQIDGNHVLRAWLDALLCAAAPRTSLAGAGSRTHSVEACAMLRGSRKRKARHATRSFVALHREGSARAVAVVREALVARMASLRKDGRSDAAEFHRQRAVRKCGTPGRGRKRFRRPLRIR